VIRKREKSAPATYTGRRGRAGLFDTHDLAEQDNILTTDEEETDPLFREHVLVVYPLDRIFQNQIGYRPGEGGSGERKRNRQKGKERKTFAFEPSCEREKGGGT
jgi:hypothetical protein